MVSMSASIVVAAASIALLLSLEPAVAVVPPDGDCVQFLPDVDLYGPNIATAKETWMNKGECRIHCLNHPQCYGVVWSDYEGGTCWLKASYEGGGVVKPGALTMLMGCQWTYVKLNNCDMPGNDLTSAARTKPDECFAACKSVDKCRAWTWSDYNGGTCWLKSAVAPCVSDGNKFSGARTGGGYW